jgi:hypothetical protein
MRHSSDLRVRGSKSKAKARLLLRYNLGLRETQFIRKSYARRGPMLSSSVEIRVVEDAINRVHENAVITPSERIPNPAIDGKQIALLLARTQFG